MGKANDPLFAIDGRHGVWSIPAWCSQYGCSEPFFYKMDIRPRSVRIGRLVRILESPAQYLERVRQSIEEGAHA